MSVKIGLRRGGKTVEYDVEVKEDARRITHSCGTQTVRNLGGGVFEVDGRIVRARVAADGERLSVTIGGNSYLFERDRRRAGAHAVEAMASPEVTAPMPGKVTQVLVAAGDSVSAGTPLVILEAMKMENRLLAEADGVVAEVAVKAGDMVNGGQVLLRIDYAAA